ncbi:hypothetical protein WA026_018126 [Henosepilachna vigintioctopunctata]|uniref:dolichol kinase n=1 Tax=Henosepilachna vigintioctopunctata TaxID=420089 RepID=A0AAW1UN35_9CUCU
MDEPQSISNNTDSRSSLGKNLNFELRPNASNGLWIMFLIPAALIISAFKHYVVLTSTYKFLPIFSIGIIWTNIFIINAMKKEDYVKFQQLWFFFPMSFMFFIFLDSGVLFSLYSGFFCTALYCKIYLLLLQTFPKSFTLGEAGITSQAFTILLYTTLPHFSNSMEEPIVKTIQSSTVIIQMEYFGILILCAFLYYFKIKSSISVYFWSFTILMITFLLPLHIFLRRSPILWVLSLLIENSSTIKIVMYWVICCCIATLFIIKKQNITEKASTSERKVFHILAAAVYIPGLIYACNLLYLGSGILLGIFFLLEILRKLSVPPLGKILQSSFLNLSDEKDAGNIALTPIYLLTGFTCPMWIHPAPCDVTDSSFFSFLPLMSGILSVGIGDTAASVLGSRYGKHYYKDSNKTMEGTLASILCQLLTVFILFQLGYIINMDILLMLRVSVATIVTSIIEAKTDQIDNAILPLIMYIILI